MHIRELVICGILVLSCSACERKENADVDLPEVDVNMTPGTIPDYKVPDVDVKTDTTKVVVPKVEIDRDSSK